jgi:transcriptional regulator with GAF, ATPase, and Fis domain
VAADPKRQSQPLVEALRRVFTQLAEPAVVLKAILDQAVVLTGADRGILVEVAPEGALTYRVLHHFEPKQLEGDAGGFSRMLFRQVIDSGREVVLDNALDHPYFGDIESVRALQANAIACMPIRASGAIAALVHLESRDNRHFSPEHVELLRSLVDVAGPILEAVQAGRDVIRERDRLRLSEDRYRNEAEETRKLLASDWSFGRFIGCSPAVRELEDTVRKAAATEYPILILGETGTGKSIVARVLHYSGPRAEGPLITVFCPTLGRDLVEAELFGHKRGAFTGAVADRLGKVAAADKGTLFLDEIGELPLEIQPKLLRLLQERTYERVGDPAERRADVRVIAATNRDLEAEVREGRFRRDLYERLCFIPILLPPLRQRTTDIALLLRHCLDQTDSGRWIELTPENREFLETLDFMWPGNVRNVEQLAARLTMEGRRGPVAAGDLSRLLRALAPGTGPGDESKDAREPDEDAGLAERLLAAERQLIADALKKHPNQTMAEVAALLQISESALYKKKRQHGLGQ